MGLDPSAVRSCTQPYNIDLYSVYKKVVIGDRKMNNYKFSGFADEIDQNFDVQLEFLNKLGVKYMEIRGVNGKNIADHSLDEVKEIKTLLDKANIKISSVGSPIGKMNLDEHEENFEKFKHIVEICKLLESPYIRMFSFFIVEGKTKADMKDKVFEYLREMIAYAKEHNVVLLHENEKGIYGDTIESCVELMENLYCDNFKACFDFANFVQCGQDAAECYEKLKPYIEYIHVKDAKGQDNVPAGMGDGQIPCIIKDVLANGYEGFFSMEPHLANFSGFANLEQDKEELNAKMSDSKTAWWFALNSFKAILYDIG